MTSHHLLRKAYAGSPARLIHRTGRHGITILAILVMLASFVAVPTVRAQDGDDPEQTPDVTLPGTGNEDEATEKPSPEDQGTPAAEDEEGDNAASDDVTPTTDEDAGDASGSEGDTALEPGHPAVISQGLAFLTGDQAVWQVREIELTDAQEETGGAAHVLQRDGETIIRNDVTAKRALLEPGEGFFRAGDDPYTFIAEGGDSTLWLFEVVAEDDVADDAFYQSPLIDQYDEGTYDSELVRFELDPGDEFDLPEHTGPSLMMVTRGEVDVEDERGLGLLGDGVGQLIAEDATVRNSGTESASFVLASFGASIDDESADAAAEPAADEEETAAGATAEPVTDTDAEEEPATDEAAEDTAAEDTAAEDTAAEDPAATGDGTFSTTINVTAQIDLYVTIVADGVTVFDGTLPAGGSSGAVAGSTFEVYTSSGVNTVFTDACGNEFLMGYEEGEATYVLAADESSCPP